MDVSVAAEIAVPALQSALTLSAHTRHSPDKETLADARSLVAESTRSLPQTEKVNPAGRRRLSYYQLFETANLGKAEQNIELFDTFRLACADNFIFLYLAF